MSDDELKKAILDLCETYQPRKPGLAKAINDLILLASASASELIQLREAVKLLGRHVRETAWQVTDEGDEVMSNVAQYIRDNPIAAAAVRGEP